MVDSEIAGRLLQEQAADAGRREDGVGMRHDHERAESAVLDHIDASREAVDLRVIPRDGEHDRRAEEDVEVVAVGCALDEVAEVEHRPAAERLLNPELALIPLPRLEDLPLAEQPVQSKAARQQQVLVVRRFHRPAVRRAQHRAAVGHGVRDAEARLDQRVGGETVVVVETEAELEGGVPRLDVVLDVRRLLLDGRCLSVGERRSPARQVEGQQIRIEIRIDLQPCLALADGPERRVLGWIAVGVETRRVDRRIGEPDRKVLVQLRGADGAADLEVVVARCVGHVRLQA